MQQVLIQCSFQCECLLAKPTSSQKSVFVVLHCVVVELSLAWKLLLAEVAMPPGHTLAVPNFICLFPDNFCLWLSWLSTRRFGGAQGHLQVQYQMAGVTTGNGESDSTSAEEEEDSSVLSPIDLVHHFFTANHKPGSPEVNTPHHC